MFDVINMLKMNNYDWVSKYIGLFICYVLEQGLYSVSNGKLQLLGNSPNV